MLHLTEVGEVVRCEDLALHDREEDLDLVQPRRMHGQMNEPEPAVPLLEPSGGGLSPVGGSVVDDPEDPAGRGVWLRSHDLGDQPVERLDPRASLAPAEHPAPVTVPGCQVLQRPAPYVLVFHPHGATGSWGKRGVAPAPSL